MANLYLLMIQKYLLTWLWSILWAYQHLDNSRKISTFFVRYTMMYPCHSLLRISEFEIIFHSGSTCKSEYETNQSIRDLRTWKYRTAYIFAPKKPILWQGYICNGQILLNFQLYSCIVLTKSSTSLSIIPITSLLLSYSFTKIVILSGT